jgi:hypothetical protein
LTEQIEAPPQPSSPAAAVHPNAHGEKGMADAVLRTIGDRTP